MQKNSTTSKSILIKNVTFDLFKGERIGIIGANGSGKTILLKLCSGLLTPSLGRIIKKTSLNIQMLSLNVGLFKNLSGEDNSKILLSLMGIENIEYERILNEIKNFSNLGVKFYESVSTYSSGMKAALGFSIVTSVYPDVLIIDEALSVGDKSFNRKAKKRIEEISNSGSTILLASHSSSKIASFCNRALYLSDGSIISDVDTSSVISEYEKNLENNYSSIASNTK